jgi:hypothetical protein
LEKFKKLITDMEFHQGQIVGKINEREEERAIKGD